jgi:micrococcal nuclease
MKLTYIFFLLALTCLGTPNKVTRVIDGDTFEIETGEKVRLIGINAPEISDIFGQEAKQYLSSLIENKIVNLEIDNISKNRDRYNRLLRYAILEGIDINKKMISDGFAFAYLKYRFSKSIDYEQNQLRASETNKGIWGNSSKGKIISQQMKKEKMTYMLQKKESSSSHDLPPKAYVVGSLMLILLIIGLFFYYKK